MEAAFLNARALVEDARTLLDAGRWPRSVALAILAIEEAGKPAILRQIIATSSEAGQRRLWRSYRRHVSKNGALMFEAFVHDYTGTHGRPPDKLDQLVPFEADEVTPEQIEQLKQLLLYTDAVDDCRWASPDDFADEDSSRAVVMIASKIVGTELGAMTSAAELRLWVKHLGPVWWDADHETRKLALLACYQEAAATGVLRGNADLLDGFARFLDVDLAPLDP
jgi:AbiV family abortive infection protein